VSSLLLAQASYNTRIRGQADVAGTELVAPGTPVAGAIIVALDGNDSTGDGSIGNPYRSLVAACNSASAGDTIYLRGGTYNTIGVDCYYTTDDNLMGESTIVGEDLKVLGTEANPVLISSYPGEWAIIDGINHPNLPRTPYWEGGDSFRHNDPGLVRFWGEWVTWSDMELRNSAGKGMVTFTRNCTFRRIWSHDHHEDCFYGQGVDNTYLECDAHDGYPISGDLNGNVVNSGDGYKLAAAGSPSWNLYNSVSGWPADWNTVTATTGTTYTRCRAWNNADDGFDTINSTGTTYDSCISMNNGYTFMGNGQGFKTGGVFFNTGNTAKFCTAINNKANGFDANGGTGITMLNNTSWGNNVGYNLNAGGAASDGSDGHNIAVNCIAFENVTAQTYPALPNNVSKFNSNTWSDTDARVGNADPLWESEVPTDTDFLRLSSSSPHINQGTTSWTDPVSSGTETFSASYVTAPDLGAIQREQTELPATGVWTPYRGGPARLDIVGGEPELTPP